MLNKAQSPLIDKFENKGTVKFFNLPERFVMSSLYIFSLLNNWNGVKNIKGMQIDSLSSWLIFLVAFTFWAMTFYLMLKSQVTINKQGIRYHEGKFKNNFIAWQDIDYIEEVLPNTPSKFANDNRALAIYTKNSLANGENKVLIEEQNTDNFANLVAIIRQSVTDDTTNFGSDKAVSFVV